MSKTLDQYIRAIMEGMVRSTKDKETNKASKRGRFLQLLSEGHSVTYAAGKVDIGRKTAYRWRDDEAFATAWDSAYEEGGDWYEDRLRDQAEAGNTTATIVGLKMRGRFIERQQVEAKVEGAINVNVDTLMKTFTVEELRAIRDELRVRGELQPPQGTEHDNSSALND